MGGRVRPFSVLIHEFVTGGGFAGSPLPKSLAAEGSAMRRALVEEFASLPGASVQMTLDERLASEPGPWQTVRIGSGGEPEAFARLARELDFTLCIAPETGGVLRDRAETIESVGGWSLGSTVEAIALTGHKLRLCEHFRSRGIATPPSLRVVPALGLPADAAYPAVLKPIDGAGSIDTFFLEGPDDLPPEALALPEALFQPFEAGEPRGSAWIVGADGPTPIGQTRQRIACTEGRFSYLGGEEVVGPEDGSLDEPRRAILAVPGLLGLVGVDAIWNPRTGRSTVLEINPRPTTSFVGLRRRFPPGTLGALWLASIDPDGPIGSAFPTRAKDESGELRRLPGPPIAFLADGSLPAS